MSECVIPEFYSYSEPVARKQHVCCECYAPILPGEKHFAYRGKWDGDLQTGRQHLLCMEACMFVRDKLNDNECIGFGKLNEFIGDAYHYLREQKTNDTVRKFRSMVAAIRMREREYRPRRRKP